MKPETRKAFDYLRKHGYSYYTDGIWESGICVDIQATFAEVDPRHIAHVRKTYPNAAIKFGKVGVEFV